MARTILHCDCNSYYASVECIFRPELKSVPMAVCGDPKNRHGIILAKNEIAKKFGVKTAETIWQAKAKCPNLTLVSPHHDQYEEYCERINAIYLQYTDRVERFSVDESWLDVTECVHLRGSGEGIADELRQRIRDEIGLTISAGVSFNKIFAKLGSDYKKPDATTVITRENFQSILWPLPARDMMFVGKVTESALADAGILTIGDIAKAGKERMTALLGRSGGIIWAYASGMDNDPVKRFDDINPAKSIGNSITFARDLIGERDIRAGLTMLCDSVGSRLREQGMYCTTVQIQIKDPSLRTIQRQRKLESATNSTKTIFDTAMAILTGAWELTAPIRLLNVTATGLTDTAVEQMTLFSTNLEERTKNAKLDGVIDSIRQKYGVAAISYGSSVNTDIVQRDSAASDARTQEPANGARDTQS